MPYLNHIANDSVLSQVELGFFVFGRYNTIIRNMAEFMCLAANIAASSLSTNCNYSMGRTWGQHDRMV